MMEMYTKLLTPLDICFAVLGLILVIMTMIPAEKYLKSNHIEDSRVNKLCISAAVFACLGVIHKVLILFSAQLASTGIISAVFYIKDMFYLIYTLMWLMFVEAMLYRSADTLKRKYRLYFIPFIILSVHIIYVLISFRFHDPDISAYTNSNLFIADRVFGMASALLATVLGASYMVRAYRLMHCYQEEIKQPVFFRLDVFFIPWLVGTVFFLTMMIPGNIPRLPDISPLCAGLSLYLTYRSMKNGIRYMDRETRFYKEELLDILPAVMEKNALDVNCAVMLSTSGDRELVAKVISELKPERSTVIARGDGGFLLLSDVQSEPAVKLFIRNVIDCTKDYGSEAEIKYETVFRNGDEHLSDFILRIQGR